MRISEGTTLLERGELEFESQAVLNPACVERDCTVHMYYRAVRPGNFSTIGYCQLQGGQITYRHPMPVLEPEFDYERQGIEDPRIVCCEGTYYLVYTAFDGINARIAYATSTDLRHFHKRGVISAEIPYHEVAEMHRDESRQTHGIFRFFNEHYGHRDHSESVLLYEKDAFLFPRKIGGRFALVHRIFPEIQIVLFEDFADLSVDFWRSNLSRLEEHTLMRPRYWFESRHIGGGCPPIETPEGWLFIYHAVEDRGGARVYHAAAALLDRDDPTRVLARLDRPLFSPEREWELVGDVGNVVFPSGATLHGDQLSIYYGAADSRIGVKVLSLAELLAELRNCPEAPAREPEVPKLHLELAGSI